jgi:hypothetical protein
MITMRVCVLLLFIHMQILFNNSIDIEYFVTDIQSNGSRTSMDIGVHQHTGQVQCVRPLDRETTDGLLLLTVYAWDAKRLRTAKCKVSLTTLRSQNPNNRQRPVSVFR